MYCPSCGEENPDGSEFCSECGTNLAGGGQGQGGQSAQAQAAPGATQTASEGGLLAPEMRVNVFGGVAAVVGLMQFITYIDTLADMLAWQGHIMFWTLFGSGGLLLAMAFLGGDEDVGGLGQRERFIAVVAALLVFSLIGSAASVAFDMPSFDNPF